MANDVRAYVPSFETVTVWHLRDLASNKRKRISCDDIKIMQLPHYEGLTIEDLLEYAMETENGIVMQALPSEKREIKKISRDYLSIVIYTIIGQPFATWVDHRIAARNAKVTEEKDLAVELDPEIAAIFRASNAVSGKLTERMLLLTFIIITL